ncbi:hypothetical protein [Streptomyces olivaceiscleroticus]
MGKHVTGEVEQWPPAEHAAEGRFTEVEVEVEIEDEVEIDGRGDAEAA